MTAPEDAPGEVLPGARCVFGYEIPRGARGAGPSFPDLRGRCAVHEKLALDVEPRYTRARR